MVWNEDLDADLVFVRSPLLPQAFIPIMGVKAPGKPS
jgi:hypothetical protein